MNDQLKKIREWNGWQPPHFTGFKLASVFFAIVLWAYVTISQNPLEEAIYSVPLETRNLSSNLAKPQINYQIQVRVQGVSSVIKELTSNDFTVYVDLGGMAAGEAMPQVELENLPDGVTLISLSPESIQLTLTPLVTTTLDLAVNVIGEPAESYTVLDPVLSPELITVSGASENINEIAAARVNADISGMSGNYSRNLSVKILNSNGEDISQYFAINPSTISVLVPIVFDQPESTVSVRAVTSGQPAAGYEVSRIVVDPATVRAFGSLDTLNALYYVETEPIQLDGLTTTTSFTIPLRHDDKITLDRDTVTVVVQIEPVTASLYEYVPKLKNLANGLKASSQPTNVQISLGSTDGNTEIPDTSYIILYVDCSGISEPGSYTLPVSAELPDNLELISIKPESVTITVEADNASAESVNVE